MVYEKLVYFHKRKNKRTATRCRVCGKQLMVAEEIKREIHEMEMNQDREIQDRIDQVYRFIDEETRPLRDNIDKLYDECNK